MVNEQLIKRYLLLELAEDEQMQFEQSLMTDRLLFERMLVIEDELIEDYLQERLPRRDREKFEQSFLSTEKGRQQVNLTRDLMEYASTRRKVTETSSKVQHPAWKRWPLDSNMRIAASILVIILGFVAWLIFIRESRVDEGLAALKNAYRDTRPLEARLSGLDYAPVLDLRSDESEHIDVNSRNQAELTLLEAVSKDPNSESHHALGQLYLAKRDYDKAISEFEKALEGEPENARIHNDLGAAWLEKGKLDRLNDTSGKSTEEFARSLEHLNKAIKIAPSSLEPLFNRAYLYQAMRLPQQAEDDWKTYLEKDQNSPWAEEARRNIKALEQQKNRPSQSKERLNEDFTTGYRNGDEDSAWRALSQGRVGTGNFITDGLLDAHLALSAQGENQEAREKLHALEYAGELEFKRAGDRFTKDLAQAYKQATPERKDILARARSLVRKATKQYEQSRLEEAIASYSEARTLFNQAGDEGESKYCDYRIGHCYVMKPDSMRSLSVFKELAQGCEKSQYKWLSGLALYSIANVQIGLGNYSEALNESKRLLKISEQISDKNGMVKALQQLGHEYVYLNNYHKSLDLHQQSMALESGYLLDPLLKWRSYFYIAIPLNFLKFHEAAVDYQKEALRLAEGLGRPQVICRSYLHLGIMLGGQKDYEEAIKNIQLAFELGNSLPTESARKESLAYAYLQLGHIHRQAGDFGQAVANYDRVIELYDELDFQAFNYMAHKGRLISCVKQGECASAEQEIQTTLGLFEQYRSKISEISNRDIFFDIEQDVYDIAIDFEYSRKGDIHSAFEYSERCRARSLLDMAGSDISASGEEELRPSSFYEPLRLEQLLERVPERVQILQYVLLEDKLIVWLVSRGKILSKMQEVSLPELTGKIKDYLDLFSPTSKNDREDEINAATYLYDLLIRPVESLLDKNKQLCIVPDKALNHLPYGALIKSESGRYFVQDYELISCPSSNMFIRLSDIAQDKKPVKSERLLSVGNPRFDHVVFPALKDIDSARREAEGILPYYDSPLCLVEENATREKIESDIDKVEVIHLALHAIVDVQSPMQSKLVLAKPRSEDRARERDEGVLCAIDIYRMKVPRARLVILSACQTGVERYYGGEGMVGIARPFIAAKVPLVVASLWPVDSEFTAQLMLSFHKHRKTENLSTAEALRVAQLEVLESGEGRFQRPYYWASFITIGGYATF